MIHIRKAVISDLPNITAIYNESIPSGLVTADTEAYEPILRTEWFYSFNEQRPLWVAVHNGKLCAWMSFKSFYGRKAYQGTVEIAIYISEAYRLKGIGHLMLLHAFREAKQLNIHTLLAFIFEQNEPSVRFFRKYGFLDYGKLPGVAVIKDSICNLLILGYKV